MSDQISEVDRKKYLRLPAAGARCSISGFTRGYYYKLEKSGDMPLLHVKQEGKKQGITLIPIDAIYAYLEKCGVRKGAA